MRGVVAAAACFLVTIAGPAIRDAGGQGTAPPAMDEHGMPQGDEPTLHLRGFTDIDFAETNHNQRVPSGFAIGQFVLHMSSSLGRKVSFFSETSFTARATTYTLEVERVIIR